jgi:hypothetical protein
MRKTPENQTTQKQKSKLFILCIQDENGTIDRIFTGIDYDQLYLQGSTESKATGGYWSTYDVHGRFIDGNYRSKVTK